MRVKVRFRFNALTGEVEAFEVDDLRDGPRLADHDARHERAAAERRARRRGERAASRRSRRVPRR